MRLAEVGDNGSEGSGVNHGRPFPSARRAHSQLCLGLAAPRWVQASWVRRDPSGPALLRAAAAAGADGPEPSAGSGAQSHRSGLEGATSRYSRFPGNLAAEQRWRGVLEAQRTHLHSGADCM